MSDEIKPVIEWLNDFVGVSDGLIYIRRGADDNISYVTSPRGWIEAHRLHLHTVRSDDEPYINRENPCAFLPKVIAKLESMSRMCDASDRAMDVGASMAFAKSASLIRSYLPKDS